MIFRQLFEPLSSTYTYLLGCEETGQAVLLDPVIVSMERDLGEIRRLGLTLAYSVDTHIHADHITAALELKNRVGCKIAAPAFDRLACADAGIEEGTPFTVGSILLQPLHTPGHTPGHFAYLLGDKIFTGDALLIDGCGRTDFQNGDAAALYKSVTEKLFSLPADTLVYPAHDSRIGTFPPLHRKRSAIRGSAKSARWSSSWKSWRTSICPIRNSLTMPCQAISNAACVRTMCPRIWRNIAVT